MRWVTQRENCWNQKDRSSKTGCKYVTKIGDKFQVIITRTLGRFDTIEEASSAAYNYLTNFDEIYKKYSHLRYKKEEIQ